MRDSRPSQLHVHIDRIVLDAGVADGDLRAEQFQALLADELRPLLDLAGPALEPTPEPLASRWVRDVAGAIAPHLTANTPGGAP